MSHLLIIKDKFGKEIAKVPVESGWSFTEVPLTKEKSKADASTTSVDIGDSGKGHGKAGNN